MIANKNSDRETSVYDAVSIRLILRRDTAINLNALVDDLGMDPSVVMNHIRALIDAGLIEVIHPVSQDVTRFDGANTFFKWKRPVDAMNRFQIR